VVVVVLAGGSRADGQVVAPLAGVDVVPPPVLVLPPVPVPVLPLVPVLAGAELDTEAGGLDEGGGGVLVALALAGVLGEAHAATEAAAETWAAGGVTGAPLALIPGAGVVVPLVGADGAPLEEVEPAGGALLDEVTGGLELPAPAGGLDLPGPGAAEEQLAGRFGGLDV
jgi:hypothetical protein